MSEEIIKEPIKRRRKPLPPFSQVGTFNTIKTVPVETGDSYFQGLRFLEHLSYSPYVNLIPLQYLAERKAGITDEAYVNYDQEEHMKYVWRSYSGIDYNTISISIKMIGRYISSAKGKAWNTLVFQENTHVLPVILPENLVYQKLHILKYKTIDLSKVIILIDSELDSTLFSIPTIRTMYRNELLPEIIQTSCTVFKVPLQFIKENCFYNKTEDIFPTNLRERRKAKEEFIEEFKQHIQAREGIIVEDLPGINGSSITINMDATSPDIHPLVSLSPLRDNEMYNERTGMWTHPMPFQNEQVTPVMVQTA